MPEDSPPICLRAGPLTVVFDRGELRWVTYSTPLTLPLAVEVREGERIRQSVTLTLHGAGVPSAKEAAPGWLSDEVVRVVVDDRRRCLTLAARSKRLLRVYVFNATPRPQDDVVTGLPPEAWRRDLRTGTGAEVGTVSVPEEATGQRVTAARDSHALRLGGHGILALDAEEEGP